MKNPTIEDSWGMGDNRIRFKIKLPCLCTHNNAEFVNYKFLYPEEKEEIPQNITKYECIHCRTVITFTTHYINNNIVITSIIEKGKNINKPESKLLKIQTEDWYQTNVTKEKVLEEYNSHISWYPTEKQVELGWAI